MRALVLVITLLLQAGCAARPADPAGRPRENSGEIVIIDASTGNRLRHDELLRRLSAVDFVLLGEVHDNPVQHELRADLIGAASRPGLAVVFEQFAETRAPIEPPEPGEELETWLKRSGFDLEAWRWPLHRPVVEAALRHGRSLWGAGITRDALRDVVRSGESAAPPHLRPLLERSPLEGPAREALERELIEGHCGQLPAAMLPGMSAAQTVRDAGMAEALLRAGERGAAWLIAGNGHVRLDFAVPRLLRAGAPDRTILSVGFLERPEHGGEMEPSAIEPFDVVVVTPRADRPDPCAAFRTRQDAEIARGMPVRTPGPGWTRCDGTDLSLRWTPPARGRVARLRSPWSACRRRGRAL